jgi:hypothetical protein
MLALWNFRAYVSPAGVRKFEQWYRVLDPSAQAAFDTLLEFLAQRTRNEWRRPGFDVLSGKQAGMGELIFEVGKLVYRPFGYFGPHKAEFTLLIGATKKGKSYDPRDTRDTAVKRMKEIQNGQGGVHVWPI